MNRIIVFIVMSLIISFSNRLNGLEMLKGDDPGKFNWTNPDLFRWSLDTKDKYDNYIDDKKQTVLKGKGWSCILSETKRRTWLVGRGRHFSEYRKVTCSSGNFVSQLETTCILGLTEKKVAYVNTENWYMDVGSSKELNIISLGCEVWHDRNQNNKHDPYEWRRNVMNWEPGKCGKCLWE